MKFASEENLHAKAIELRGQLEQYFNVETAYGNELGSVASLGHCAVVSYIVFNCIGGSLVSAIVQERSHWFNRIQVGTKLIDLDLTGDQYGRPPIQIAEKDHLYSGTRLRQPEELTSETLSRAKKLANKAGINSITNFTSLLK